MSSSGRSRRASAWSPSIPSSALADTPPPRRADDVEGESAAALAGSILTSLAEDIGKPASKDVARQLESAEIVYDYAAGDSLNAKTLQPDYIYTGALTTYTIGDKTTETLEQHEYYFDWTG